MKIFLPAIEGLVPADMVCCVHAFLDFCYLVQHYFHDTKSLKKLLTIFTSTAASSLMLDYEKILIFQDNTCSATMFILFASMSPLMAYAPPSLRTNTSKGWRNHGNNQTDGRPCTKCLLQISTWTNWQHCALSSSHVACWKALACLMSYTNYVCQLIMFVEST